MCDNESAKMLFGMNGDPPIQVAVHIHTTRLAQSSIEPSFKLPGCPSKNSHPVESAVRSSLGPLAYYTSAC